MNVANDIPAYFAALPGCVTVQDRDLRIVAANRRFSESFAGGIGSYCYQAYKQRSERCNPCPVAATFADGRSHSSEELVKRRNGRGCDRCSLVPVDGGETRASAIPDVDVSRSDGHDKAPEGAQAVLGLWS
ncbi:MAG: hypothetical protein V2A73_01465, partial [Pseudomonadota bacterium]